MFSFHQPYLVQPPINNLQTYSSTTNNGSIVHCIVMKLNGAHTIFLDTILNIKLYITFIWLIPQVLKRQNLGFDSRLWQKYQKVHTKKTSFFLVELILLPNIIDL